MVISHKVGICFYTCEICVTRPGGGGGYQGGIPTCGPIIGGGGH